MIRLENLKLVRSHATGKLTPNEDEHY